MKVIALMIATLAAAFTAGPASLSDAFALDLYARMADSQPGQNGAISPLSASLALSLLCTGAQGQTADEITEALGFDCSASEVSSFYSGLMTQLLKADPSTTLETANSIWAGRTAGLKRNFIRSSRKYFDAQIRNVDFESPGTTGQINSWCSDKTHGRIPSIIDKVDPKTVVAMINALYFDGRWRNGFDESHPGTFRCADGGTTQAEMMTNTVSCRYSEDELFRMVELEYGNGAFVMDIILGADDNPENFGQAVSCLTASEWENLSSGLHTGRVHVELPSFRMECEYDLIPYLRALGIERAFSAGADFSGISKMPLHVSQTIQKTFIDVNRKGTEAAAVTYIGIKLTSAGPADTVRFVADRPFIFILREVGTGAILFIGQKTR